MSEDEVRDRLGEIDALRKRAETMSDIARWPMGVPSELHADKKRGWFKSIWRGNGETSFGEILLTRDERREIVEWMQDKSDKLRAQANEIAASLNNPRGSRDD